MLMVPFRNHTKEELMFDENLMRPREIWLLTFFLGSSSSVFVLSLYFASLTLWVMGGCPLDWVRRVAVFFVVVVAAVVG